MAGTGDGHPALRTGATKRPGLLAAVEQRPLTRTKAPQLGLRGQQRTALCRPLQRPGVLLPRPHQLLARQDARLHHVHHLPLPLHRKDEKPQPADLSRRKLIQRPTANDHHPTLRRQQLHAPLCRSPPDGQSGRAALRVYAARHRQRLGAGHQECRGHLRQHSTGHL